jgi:geranylgeranyl pyrophosphate synthase
MSLGYTEKKDLEKLIEVDKEKILDILEDYPGAALLLALEEDCIDKALEKFKRIVRENKEMKRIINFILEQKQDGDVKISPALRDSMKEFKE